MTASLIVPYCAVSRQCILPREDQTITICSVASGRIDHFDFQSNHAGTGTCARLCAICCEHQICQPDETRDPFETERAESCAAIVSVDEDTECCLDDHLIYAHMRRPDGYKSENVCELTACESDDAILHHAEKQVFRRVGSYNPSVRCYSEDTPKWPNIHGLREVLMTVRDRHQCSCCKSIHSAHLPPKPNPPHQPP